MLKGVLMSAEPAFIDDSQHHNEKAPILKVFSDFAESLQKSISEDDISNRFLPKLVELPGIEAAAIYTMTKADGNFVLSGFHGLPDGSFPPIRALNSGLVEADESLVRSPAWDLIKDESLSGNVRFFTTSVLKANEQINGLLIVGWDLPATISAEIKDAISAIVIMLGSAVGSARLYSELEDAHIDSIAIINKLVSVVDEFGKGHSTRVAKVAEAIAREMGFKNEQLNLVYEAGIVHDVGRICIPPEILNKPGKLTPDEYEIVKEHPRVGAGLLAPVSIYKEIVPGVLSHHERLDGSGYPEGLTAEKIPLLARILAVADVYDAMTTNRSYRPAHALEYAIITLMEGSGRIFDAEVVNAFARAIKKEAEI
jgi:HD-GYP domain-containing protein (c-di-GMP phosphodiesterase class II)